MRSKNHETMAQDPDTGDTCETTALEAELRDGIVRAVEDLVGGDQEDVQATFDFCLARATDLVSRKRDQSGTKNDTRDLLGELLFSRLRRGLGAFMGSPDGQDAARAAQWVMGSLFSSSALSEFASALDKAILSAHSPRDFSFAGRADFIRVEEVLQMMAAGKKDGQISLENDENRLDIYMHGGRIAFLDPHRLFRRVLPSADGMTFKEIPIDKLLAAEKRRVREGTPMLLALCESGVFRPEELAEVSRQLGMEVFYDFLRDQSSCCFFYRKMSDMPAFATEHDMCLAVTPLLLEASKRLDDWHNMSRAFPDPDAPVEPMPDMFASIGDLNLGVLEIKLLSQVDGHNSPRDIMFTTGLPLHDVYLYLVKLAREGAVRSAQPAAEVEDLYMSVEESMQTAFEILDSNDDQQEMGNALDRVFGDGEDGGEGLFGGMAERHTPRGGDAEGSSDDIGAEFIRSLKNL